MKVWSFMALHSVLAGNPDALIDAFKWEETPQGFRYWRDRFRRAAPLTDYDRGFLIRVANEERRRS